MDFALNDDHLALREAVQRFCDGEYPAHERGNAPAPETAARRHAAMAEMGLLGLPFDPELGGSGQGPVETMLVAQALGRALGGGAWFSSVVLAGQLLARAGSPEQCSQWLPRVASGELRLALACSEPQARFHFDDVQTRARRGGRGWVLDGRKSLVLEGDSAELLLVVARTAGERHGAEGLSLFAVDADAPGLRVHGFNTLDGRRAAHVELSGVELEPGRLVGAEGGAHGLLDETLDRANAALCAEAAGAIEALVDLTTEQLRTRKQFGAPLMKFQVLQHRLADMVIALEQAKSMACAAAMALEVDSVSQRRRLVSAAKVLAAQLGRQASLAAIQMHGAMGMTEECRVGHYAKRLMAIGQILGDAHHHLRRFGEQAH